MGDAAVTSNDDILRIQRHWDDHHVSTEARSRWWQSGIVWQHLNARYFGRSSANKFESHQYLIERFPFGFE